MKKLTLLLALIGVTLSSSVQGAALPVKLLSFEANKSSSVVKLEWSATTEVKSLQFIAERSTDGINFTAFSTVKASVLDEGIATYDLLDSKPLEGTTFYRLRMEDNNGNFTYSQIRKIVHAGTGVTVALLEQPVINVLRLNSEAKAVAVIDMSGRIVKQFAGKADGSYDVSDMLPGFYMVRVENADGVAALRMVKN